MPVLKGLDRALSTAGMAFTVLAAGCLAAMIVLNAANMAVREATGAALTFVFPWTVVLFIWTTFFALYPLVRNQRDVVVDVLVNRAPQAVRLCLALVADILGVLLFGMMVFAAPTIIGMQFGEMDMIPLPIFVQSVPLFLSALLIVVHLSAHAVALLTGDKKPFDHSHRGKAVEEGAPE